MYSLYGQISDDEGRVGSVYSGLGLGKPVDFKSPIAEGMGLIGVAIFETDVTNASNPALWGGIRLTRGSAGLSIENFESKNSQDEVVNTLFLPQQFQLEFPLKKNKIGFSFSMAPITRSNFRTLETQTILPERNILGDSLGIAQENSREGGLNRFEMGIGWKISDKLSVGYAGSAIFGTIDDKLTASFSDPGFEGVNIVETVSHLGFGNRFGVLYTKRSLFKKSDWIDIGLTYNLSVDLDGDRELTSDIRTFQPNGGITLRTLDLELTEEEKDGDLKFPMQLATGVTYHLNEVWAVATELLYQKWSGFENFDSNNEKFMKDRYRIGVGGNYNPFNKSTSSFFSKFKYRMGVTYDTGYLNFAGNNIDALFLNAGFSFLARRSLSSIDFNFMYGVQGTRSNNLIKENIMGMRITFNLSELMFERRKFR